MDLLKLSIQYQNSLVVQWVKNLALLLQWHGFKPWPGNFHMSWAWPEGKKKNLSSTDKDFYLNCSQFSGEMDAFLHLQVLKFKNGNEGQIPV